MATEPDPALSPLQVGVILDRSSSTVRRMIDCGALESFRAGSHRRVRLSEVNRFRREREKLWQALGVISIDELCQRAGSLEREIARQPRLLLEEHGLQGAEVPQVGAANRKGPGLPLAQGHRRNIGQLRRRVNRPADRPHPSLEFFEIALDNLPGDRRPWA